MMRTMPSVMTRGSLSPCQFSCWYRCEPVLPALIDPGNQVKPVPRPGLLAVSTDFPMIAVCRATR